jgi:hypothetical protein
MPLKKILFKPGINRENTRYTTEGGWYDGDKIRFRQGTPEMIGGWQQVTNDQFLGVCRSLWAWNTLGGETYVGIGTNLKFYLENGAQFYDITPVRATADLTDPFTATLGSSVITVADTSHDAVTGDFVTFSGADGLGGNITAGVLNQDYQITVVDTNSYTIDTGVAANATDVSGSPGGGSVTATYQIYTGPEVEVPLSGWGAGGWGLGGWGVGDSGGSTPMRIWSQSNWGQDLVFAPNQGTLYYWSVNYTTSSPGVAINTGLGGDLTVTIANPAVVTFASVVLSEGTSIQLATTGALPTGLTAGTTYYVRNPNGNTANLSTTPAGALVTTSGSQSGTHSVALLEDVPVALSFVFVSDTYRFLMAFGANPLTSSEQDRLLIRWASQESLTDWYPSNTNQAGELRLSHGSAIVTAVQTRQEIFTITDSAAYSLQYVGPPFGWGAQLMADNISIVSQNGASVGSGIVYWMGLDKFYKYDGRVQTLRCDLREYIYSDINLEQSEQIYSGTNEGYNEAWWFYCSANSSTLDRYVIYNYAEDIWYYGQMARTAWLDSGLLPTPLATNYSGRLIKHELGLNNAEEQTPVAIPAYITSSEFDIEDGHNFGFVWRILPDLTFRNSTAGTPTVTMTLYPLLNSGSGYLVPASEGGTNYAAVAKQQTVNVEAFTGQVNVRVRGRQMAMKISSDQLNTTWQLGAPRIDIKADGRRGG